MFRDRLRTVLREMIVIAVIISLPLYFLDHDPGIGTAVNSLLISLLISPVPWLVYRGLRFAVGH